MEQQSGSASRQASGSGNDSAAARASLSTSVRAALGRVDDAHAPCGDATIRLSVNGEWRCTPAGLMLPEVLEALGYRPQLVVVEFNGEILPRQRWSEQPVVETDVLEVVTIVGGGS